MKKRVLSVLLVIALLVAVGIIAAQADPQYTPEQIITLSEKQVTDQVFAGSDPVEATCYACGEPVTWNPISNYKHATTDGHYLTSGHYFLDEDLNGATDSDIIVNGANGNPVCLQLNGKKITNTLNGSCAILYWSGSSPLNVMGGGDCQNTSSWATLTVRQNVPVNIYGGSFKNNGGNQRAVSVENGTVNLYDVNAGESVIYTAAGTTNIYSGSYKTLLAGLGAVNINGAPTIGTVDFTNAGTVRPTYGVLDQGASIGFGSYNGVISAAYTSPEEATAAAAAFPVKAGLMLTVTDKNELSLGPKVYTPATTVEEIISKSYLQSFEGSEPVADYCYACNRNVTWQPISAYVNGVYGHYLSAADHYFLDKDLAQTNDSDVIINGANSGNTICLHLNGKTISNKNATGSAILYWSGSSPLNIMGSGVCENSSSWSTLKVNAAVTVNVYGGSYTNKGSNQYAVSLEKTGQLNLYGVNASKTLYAAAGTTTVKSGSYEKILVGAGQLSLSGAPVVDDLDITGAVTKPTYGVMTQGASIGFGSYTGVISSAYDTPEEAKAVADAFPAIPGSTVTVNGDNTLSISTKTYTPAEIVTESAKQVFQGTEPVKAFCYVCGVNTTWQPITGAGIINAAGHYFLTDSIEGSGDHAIYTWGSNATVCLHLNGKTLSATGAGCAAFASYDADTSVNLMGGTLTSEATNVGAVYCHAAAATNIYGCTVVNTGGNGRSIYADNANGTANIYGVDTSDNYIYASTGAIKMESGSCRGLIIGANVTSAKVSGTPTIAAVDLSAATVKLDATGLTGGRIGLGETEGVFTTAFETTEKAEAASAFFTTPSLAVVVVDKQLTTAEAAAAIVTANGQKAYESYAAAEAAYTDGYIKMFVDNDIVVTKNVTIDLNGQHIDASGSGVLTVMDSKTYQNYAAEPGSIVVTAGDVTVEAPATQTAQDGTVSGYLPVESQGIITATYFQMKLSGVALRATTETVGLYYKGTWSFNDYLPEGKVEAGVVVNVLGAPAAGFRDVEANGYFAKDAATVINGQPVTSVLVDGIMKAEGREPATNSQYGQTKINAAAFVTVNGVDILTEIKSLSVKDILEMFEKDENIEQYNKVETKLANFYTAWKDLANLEAWGLTKIGK